MSTTCKCGNRVPSEVLAKRLEMPAPFYISAQEIKRMSAYTQYLIDCAVGYEEEVLLGDESRTDPECSAEFFVMNSPAHGYAHMALDVHKTRDMEALRKLVARLEEAKMRTVQRILQLEAEENAE